MTVCEILWNREKGWGFLPPKGECDKDYWEEYRALDKTPVGIVLTEMRRRFVEKFEIEEPVVDVGIGGGAFVEMMRCLGTDINAQALDWLRSHDRAWDGEAVVGVMTFWDSLEHIEHPGELFDKALGMVFISTPIYRDVDHCIHSKHYKPSEHLWYFTDRGLKIFMAEAGYLCVEQNRMEEDVGREDIGTYAFERV